jgi:hypothetical protein
VEQAFEPFKDRVSVRLDERYVYVESSGLPNHPAMAGIRNWQQQVVLPQAYSGANAWRLPRTPVLAAEPLSARNALFEGAIALAVNGVPIFNALNNRGEDTLGGGELDRWNGHCGRADDYHYHAAPLHLMEYLTQADPIAFALDGFPIYGPLEPDGSEMRPLDELNGHFDESGDYHYHGTKTFPYINGGLRGVVQVRGDHIEPQPRTTPVRPALQPLRDATVTGWTPTGEGSYSLEYQRAGGRYLINYRIEPARYAFEFVDPSGAVRQETYPRR